MPDVSTNTYDFNAIVRFAVVDSRNVVTIDAVTTTQTFIRGPADTPFFIVDPGGSIMLPNIDSYNISFTTPEISQTQNLGMTPMPMLLELVHADGTATTVLYYTWNLAYSDGSQGIVSVCIYLSGDPLPSFADTDAYSAWLTSAMLLPSSDPRLSPGQMVLWEDFDLDLPPAGTEGADTMVGSAGADSLAGLGGDDLLRGLAGPDTLLGGAGNDTLQGGLGGENDTLDGGDGSDTADYSDIIFPQPISIDLAAGTASLSFYVGTDTLISIENVIGAGGNDTISGDAGGNRLEGGAGDDRLNGRAGADTMLGGAGNDSYVVDSMLDRVRETSASDGLSDAGGVDTVLSSVSFNLDAYAGVRFVERLTLTGDANLAGIGNALDNTLVGNAGNNRLDGGAGSDTMGGGAGNDTYLVDTSTDRVYETTQINGTTDAGGTDTVISAVSFSLASSQGVRFVERLTLTGSANLSGIGNALANTLEGNAGNNLLDGRQGNDTMRGGAGNDSYVVDSVLDRVHETTAIGGGIDAGGTDTVSAAVSFNLDAYQGVRFVERLTLTGTANINGSGNALANVICGNSGNNLLNGGAGVDTLTGGAGADVFVFSTAPGVGSFDRITDFSVADDSFWLDDAVFAGLAPGQLADTAFTINDTGLATDATERLIYDTDSGRLYFDADGSGAAGRVLLATLSTGLALTAADFNVI